MKERPILFSAPMVRALLDGRKTQTRRAIKPQPEWLPEVQSTRESGGFFWPIGGLGQQCGAPILKCPYGAPGDRLWVREAWQSDVAYAHTKPSLIPLGERFFFRADGGSINASDLSVRATGWRPGIHQPRWASRITLQITDVRVERLQDISEADAMAEGITCENVIVGCNGDGGRHHEVTAARYFWEGGEDEGYQDPVSPYADLWEHINGPGAWAENPFVWAVEFRRLTP